MKPEKPKAILFDWDNTLVDSWNTIHRAWNVTLEAMGHKPWTVAEARERIGPPADKAFPPIFGDRWKDAEKIFYDFFERSPDRFAQPLTGAQSLLDAAANLNVFLGVVSNKRGPHLRAEAAHLGWDKYFGVIVGAGDASAAKPDPAPMLLALQDSGIVPSSDVWYIGDHHTDLVFAKNTGCVGILVNGHDLDERVLIEAPPVHVFRDCPAFEVFLRENYLF